MKFAANLNWLYQEYSLLDRFESARRDGFTGVELLNPYVHTVVDLRARLQASGLTQVLINAPNGDPRQGERGFGCLPTRRADFRRSVLRAIDYAVGLRCPNVHVQSGIRPAGVDEETLRDTLLENLSWAAAEAAASGLGILIEPINPHDMPGYFLSRQAQAHDIVTRIDAPNLNVQMDLYHCQIVEGNVTSKLRQYVPAGRVGHIQIAGVPERHEPDTGELDYRYVLGALDSLGYRGWIGCEYGPAAATSEGVRRWTHALENR